MHGHEFLEFEYALGEWMRMLNSLIYLSPLSRLSVGLGSVVDDQVVFDTPITQTTGTTL